MSEKIPVCLQMYTVRDDAANDFAGTLAQIAKIGYAGVELAGYAGLAPGAVKQILDDNNLFVCGAHVQLSLLENEMGRVIDEANMLGYEYVIVPYLGDEWRKSMDDYRRLAGLMNEWGARLRESELQLAYHNHAFEFETFGGTETAFDVFFAAMEPDAVKVELDTFWVKKAGINPAASLQKYAGRVPLVHLKDMTDDAAATFAPVGTGIMDYPALFDAAETAGGVEYYVVEQDQCVAQTPLESIQISWDNLQKMGKV